MRFNTIVPLAALSSAFVLPPQEVIENLAVEDHHQTNLVDGFKQYVQDADDIAKTAWTKLEHESKNAIDAAIGKVGELTDGFQESAADAQLWLESEFSELLDEHDDPHHGPPHHRPGHGGSPHHPPHHGHDKPNLTVYQMIAESKYTTKLAKLINEYDDLVEALNSTKANYTVFAPTDKAFEKIPDHAPKPSKEQLKAILEYHVVPDFYPAGRVLVTHTMPTLLKGDHLGSKPLPQRLSLSLGLGGLKVNFYSRIIAVNIFATNGVIHGVDSIIIPPPRAIKIIDLLPGEFSSLELGLLKTGLLEKLNTTDHAGGTLFAPSNFAFQKLGPKINAFLFSQYGLKYLKALLQYHVVPDNTLYSDAYYQSDQSNDEDVATIPKGYFHVDLPTLLEDRSLAVDIARYGGFIRIKINAFSTVTIQDAVAEDGVIQVVSDVLVPPKKVSGKAELQYWDGEELSVEEFKERLEPFMAKSDL